MGVDYSRQERQKRQGQEGTGRHSATGTEDEGRAMSREIQEDLQELSRKGKKTDCYPRASGNEHRPTDTFIFAQRKPFRIPALLNYTIKKSVLLLATEVVKICYSNNRKLIHSTLLCFWVSAQVMLIPEMPLSPAQPGSFIKLLKCHLLSLAFTKAQRLHIPTLLILSILDKAMFSSPEC